MSSPFLLQAGVLPNPFPIPKFRPATEKNFLDKGLNDIDRKYVVQTMATMLMTYIQKPSLSECSIVAKSLIKKYEFLKDDEGDGEVSFICNTQEYIMNVFCVFYLAFLEVVFI